MLASREGSVSTRTKHPSPGIVKPPQGACQAEYDDSVWGTKWDLDDMEGNLVATDLTNSGEAFFNTAWSPPLPVIGALSRMFPGDAFRLDYHEPGMIFAGRAVFRAGNTDDTYFEGEADVNRIGREVFGWEYDADDGGEDIPEPTTPNQSNQSCQPTVPPPAATTSPCGTKPRSADGPDGSA